MDTDPVLEGLMSQLGEFGRYQLIQHLLHLLSSYLAGVHMLSISLVAPTPAHRCFIEELDGHGGESIFNQSLLAPYIPNKENGELDQCHMYTDSTKDNVASCLKYVYDTTYYKTSRVYEWDLVCDNRWERAFIQSVYMGGVLFGAIIFGSLSDKFGRKKIFYISGLLQLFFGFTSAFLTNFWLYSGCLFFYGMFGSGGAYVTGFVLSMELVGPKKRTLCGTLFSLSFAIGVMTNAFWGYMIRDVQILQCVFALHALTVVGHWWLIDESIRWLWGQGRKVEAARIVEKAVKINGKIFVSQKLHSDSEQELSPSDTEDTNQNQNTNKNTNKKSIVQNERTSYGATDLFKTPQLRKRILCVSFNWFANSLVYYGLSLNSGHLAGNPFLVFFFIGFAELPGYLLVITCVDRTGRRSLCSALLILGGLACLIVALIPKGTIVTILTLVGKMGIAGSFAIAYNFTAELFPTVVRNSAVGVGAMSARFSGVLTPLITLLDTIDLRVPTVVFGTVSIIAALLTLFLPETVGKELAQTLKDGENFGRGDTGYAQIGRVCCGRDKDKKRSRRNSLKNPEEGETLSPA